MVGRGRLLRVIGSSPPRVPARQRGDVESRWPGLASRGRSRPLVLRRWSAHPSNPPAITPGNRVQPKVPNQWTFEAAPRSRSWILVIRSPNPTHTRSRRQALRQDRCCNWSPRGRSPASSRRAAMATSSISDATEGGRTLALSLRDEPSRPPHLLFDRRPPRRRLALPRLEP